MKMRRMMLCLGFLWVSSALVLSSCKEMGLDSDNSGSNSNGSSLTITSIGPSEKSCDIPINRSLTLTFSDAVDTSNLTTNTNSDECTGSFQVSSNQFSTCVRMSATPAVGNSNRSFEFTPAEELDVSSDYDVRVTTGVRSLASQNLAGEYILTGCFTSGALPDQTAPLVTVVTPFSLYDRMPINTGFVVTFNEPMSIPTLTTNTTEAACTGSIQLSDNDFFSCVRMIRDPEPSPNHKSFTVKPAENLGANRVYKLKVTTAVKDGAGNALAADFLIIRGLTTGTEPDATAPVVTDITPINGLEDASVKGPITVRFSERMDPASIRANVTDTDCSQTIHVSTNDFTSCVRMISNIEEINAGRSFAFHPVAEMAEGAHYQIKVITDATDLAGNSLANETFYASGYTTTQSPFDYSSWDLDVWAQ